MFETFASVLQKTAVDVRLRYSIANVLLEEALSDEIRA